MHIYIYMCPWRFRGNTWGEARGTVAVLFPGCITSPVVALVERCVTVAFQPFVALSKMKKKYKNLLRGIISRNTIFLENHLDKQWEQKNI